MAGEKYGIPYSPELIDTPKPAQPPGFWEKMSSLNQGNKVMGMPANDFSVMFGNLAKAIAPNSIGGRMGEAAAGVANQQRTEKIAHDDPAQQLARMRLSDIQGRMTPTADTRPTADVFSAPNFTDLTTASAAMSPAGPPPAPAPTPTFAQAYGQQVQEMEGPAKLDYQRATTEGARENVNQLKLMNDKLAQIIPSEVAVSKAQATTAGVQANVAQGTQAAQIEAPGLQNQLTGQTIRSATSAANVAEATEPQKIEAAGAELQKLYGEAALLGKQNEYFKQIYVDNPRAQLSLQEQKLREDIQTRRTAMFSDAGKQFSALSNAVSQNAVKEVDKNPRQAPAIMHHAGSALISEGLNFYSQTANLADVDIASSRKTQLASSVATGMNYMVDGVNSAKNIGDKTAMTYKVIKQLDDLRTKGQPGLADAYESALFGGRGPLAGKTDTHFFSKDDVFDPVLAYKAYRSGVR